LPILKPEAIVPPECYVRNLAACTDMAETIEAVARTTVDGWTWYAPASYNGNQYLMGIEHLPAEPGGNTAPFEVQLTFSKKICDPGGHPLVHGHLIKSPESGTFVSGYYCNFNVIKGALSGHVNIRFFPLDNYTDALNTRANEYENDLQEPSVMRYVHTLEKAVDLPADFPEGQPGLSHPFALLNIGETGSYLGYSFVGFKGIRQLHQTGMAAMRLLHIEQYAATPRVICRFTGNGNFSDASNWLHNVSPLAVGHKQIDIIIDPAPGGQCMLDVPFAFEQGMTVTVTEGKVFVVQ
ncbi:MAG TPA: hypothetical protein VK907_05165, partial [Phnomibacter sp.]|nr:hypothetical protein [Phnomibacter sp.]